MKAGATAGTFGVEPKKFPEWSQAEETPSHVNWLERPFPVLRRRAPSPWVRCSAGESIISRSLTPANHVSFCPAISSSTPKGLSSAVKLCCSRIIQCKGRRDDQGVPERGEEQGWLYRGEHQEALEAPEEDETQVSHHYFAVPLFSSTVVSIPYSSSIPYSTCRITFVESGCPHARFWTCPCRILTAHQMLSATVQQCN